MTLTVNISAVVMFLFAAVCQFLGWTGKFPTAGFESLAKMFLYLGLAAWAYGGGR